MIDLSKTLYHGSYCEVREPDIKKCEKNRDFGQGFYLTTSFKQAKSFLPLSIRKRFGADRREITYGYISSFRMCNPLGLNMYNFETANEHWLRCVVAHRRDGSFPDIVERYRPFDAITGKVSDDDTNTTVSAYMGGLYGKIGSQQAIQFCISLLLPRRLKDQICLRTEKAIACLEFERSEKIDI